MSLNMNNFIDSIPDTVITPKIKPLMKKNGFAYTINRFMHAQLNGMTYIANEFTSDISLIPPSRLIELFEKNGITLAEHCDRIIYQIQTDDNEPMTAVDHAIMVCEDVTALVKQLA